MNDRETSIGQLREVVRQFVDERDWQQFHAPKNLSMALAIEAAELMEHFQWITPQASPITSRNVIFSAILRDGSLSTMNWLNRSTN